MQNRTYILLLLFILVGAVLRFSFLDWGKPFFFHPDENNITIAISGLSFHQWNPHFFAYGSLPIYFTYLTAGIISFGKPTFQIITYTLRFYSALLSFLLIPSLFYIGNKLYNRSVGLIAAALASLSIGFIQYAHFGTFEMWLTFFIFWFFYSCYLTWNKLSKKHLLCMTILGGIIFSIKISSIVFLPIPLFILMHHKSEIRRKIFSLSFFYAIGIFLIFIITNPFALLDTTSYVTALHYESSVALGSLSVFYTQTFLQTTPILYQLRFVFPFLLNPIIFFLFLISIIFFIVRACKQRKTQDLILLLFLSIAFFSQVFFFVKWNRYMMPTLPFIYLITAIGIHSVKEKASNGIFAFCVFISCVYSFLFFLTVYPIDSRIVASNFSLQHFSSQKALIEPYDLGAMTFTNIFPDAKTINIYEIDHSPIVYQNLITTLVGSDIFLSPSQRLFHTRRRDAIDFPNGNLFYKNLFDGSFGFHIAYQTPCTIWCKLLYNGDPFNNVEETATVFDHPFITIFQKR